MQRPLDTKNQLRLAGEAEAILSILPLCESGQAELVASEAVVFEAGRNPHPVRKRYAAEVLSKATICVPTEDRGMVTEEEVRAILAHPDVQYVGIDGKQNVLGEVNGKHVRICFVEDQGRLLVITVINRGTHL